jgi:hypothetical protein
VAVADSADFFDVRGEASRVIRVTLGTHATGDLGATKPRGTNGWMGLRIFSPFSPQMPMADVAVETLGVGCWPEQEQ